MQETKPAFLLAYSRGANIATSRLHVLTASPPTYLSHSIVDISGTPSDSYLIKIRLAVLQNWWKVSEVSKNGKTLSEVAFCVTDGVRPSGQCPIVMVHPCACDFGIDMYILIESTMARPDSLSRITRRCQPCADPLPYLFISRSASVFAIFQDLQTPF